MPGRRRVLVVGGGVTGLAAAVELCQVDDLSVTVWEAADRLGGKISTSPFAGLDHVDEAADAYLVRVPHAVTLARTIGLDGESLTAPSAASAAVWHDGLHPIPSGIVLGVPGDLRPFATSRLLSWRGKARAAIEPLLPRTDPDDSIGRLIRARFGNEVHERLVDSLVGSIYATDTDHSSLAAVPQLAELARRNRSLLLAAAGTRRKAAQHTPGAPIFAAPRAGMGALVEHAARFVAERGGSIVTGRSADSIERSSDPWLVDGEPFDAVILASPALASAALLRSVAPAAAAALERFEQAGVIMVRLAIPDGDWPSRLHGMSGYLVPKPDQRTLTAASFASQKWAHWRPADGSQILRLSLGRDGLPVDHLDDDAVLHHTLAEASQHLGFDLAPTAVSITRWPGAFPQYRPHHHRLVAAVEQALPPGIVLAGASYRGIGIPACVADGVRAARAVGEATIHPST